MPGTSGTSCRVLFSEFDMSAHLQDSSVSHDVDLVDSTTYGDAAHEFTVVLENGTISLNGIWSAAAGASDPVFAGSLATAGTQVITVCPAGYGTIGNRCSLATTRSQNYQVGSPVADIVKFSLAAQADGGIDGGVILHTLTSETGASNTASVNNTASSANGGVGNLHVTAFSGTNITIKIQHSANDSTWADLATFTVVSGVTSERVTVAAATTVNQYLRVLWTGTFSSCTFAVAFARR